MGLGSGLGLGGAWVGDVGRSLPTQAEERPGSMHTYMHMYMYAYAYIYRPASRRWPPRSEPAVLCCAVLAPEGGLVRRASRAAQ